MSILSSLSPFRRGIDQGLKNRRQVPQVGRRFHAGLGSLFGQGLAQPLSRMQVHLVGRHLFLPQGRGQSGRLAGHSQDDAEGRPQPILQNSQ